MDADNGRACPAGLLHQAADEITRLREEVARLRGALKGMLDNACAACDEDYVIRVTKREWDAHVKATDIARAALTQ
jgi:hypothetical protein